MKYTLIAATAAVIIAAAITAAQMGLVLACLEFAIRVLFPALVLAVAGAVVTQ